MKLKSYLHILKNEFRPTIQLAIPMIIAQVGQMLMGLVDSAMVGRLGATPLAAVAVGNGLFMVILIIGIGLTMAISPITAEFANSSKRPKAGRVLNQSLIMNLVFAVVLTFLAFYSVEIIRFLGQSTDVEYEAIRYTKILAYSTFPMIIFFVYKSFTEGLEKPKASMVINLLANSVNFLVNYLLIFGHAGFPRMEIEGAGWATFVSRVFMMIAIIIYVHKKNSYKEFHLHFSFKDIDLELMKRLFTLGMSSAIQYFFEVTAFIFAAFMIGWLGAIPLAAHQIAINLASLTYMFALGVSMASAVRVAGFWGQKNYSMARSAGMASLFMIIIIMLSFACIFLFSYKYLPQLYIDDPAVIEIASGLILIAALFQMGDGIQATMLGALRGTSDVFIPMGVTFIAYWVLALPLAYLMGFILNLGVLGVWYALSLALYASGIMLTWRFLKRCKK